MNFGVSVVLCFVLFFIYHLKMAGKMYQFDNRRDVEELQRLLLELNDQSDRVGCKNKSDLEEGRLCGSSFRKFGY